MSVRQNLGLGKPNLELWEILVPMYVDSPESFAYTKFKDKKGESKFYEVKLKHHHKWDEYVRGLTGGLTIFKSAQGQWTDEDNRVYKESMIPIRVAGTSKQIGEIAKFTKEHYKQKAVFFYMVSKNVCII